MAFLMASASSSLASGFLIDVSVTFLFALVNVHLPCIDNVVYERSVSECIKIGYLQQQQSFCCEKIRKKFWPHTPLPSVRSQPHSKILGTPLLCPVLIMKSQHTSASVCHVTLRVYCWVHFVTIANCMVTCWAVVRVKSCLGLDKKVLFTSLVCPSLRWSCTRIVCGFLQ